MSIVIPTLNEAATIAAVIEEKPDRYDGRSGCIRPGATRMSHRFALGEFLTRWNPVVRHDLSSSDSETLTVAALLRLAEPDDRRRWTSLGLGYGTPRGAPWLREAIAARHASLDADDVLCCGGAQEALFCAASAVLNASDHAVVILPIYQPSEQAVTALCATTGVPIEEPGWRLDIDRVAAALRPNTKLVLANFPNSPTGASLDPAALADLVALCRRHGAWLVIDEVYRQTDRMFDSQMPMVADAYERGVSINGLSKGFGLPGLRVGWAACRDRWVLSRMLSVKSMLSTCLSTASEVLAHIALQAEPRIVERRRAIGWRNHRKLAALIRRVPSVFAAEPPSNLAFAFPRCLTPYGSEAFAAKVINEAGVLVLPSELWHSPLAALPAGRVRIGLGHTRNAEGVTALSRYLMARQPQDKAVAKVGAP